MIYTPMSGVVKIVVPKSPGGGVLPRKLPRSAEWPVIDHVVEELEVAVRQLHPGVVVGTCHAQCAHGWEYRAWGDDRGRRGFANHAKCAVPCAWTLPPDRRVTLSKLPVSAPHTGLCPQYVRGQRTQWWRRHPRSRCLRTPAVCRSRLERAA